mgnify:CR=1 FL=1
MNDSNNKHLTSNEESKFKQTYLGGGGRAPEDASAHQSNVAMRYEQQRPSGVGASLSAEQNGTPSVSRYNNRDP